MSLEFAEKLVAASSLAVGAILLTLARRRLEDVVHPEDHLGSLGGLDQDLALHLEALRDPHFDHVTHFALKLLVNSRDCRYSI